MIFYYAPGGGLGHLTRARAVIHTLGLQDVTIITASPFADDKRVVGDLKVIRLYREFEHNPDGYKKWLASLFHHNKPTDLFIDTFPVGIAGEFNNFYGDGNMRLHYVARALRWDYYGKLITGAAPQFDTVYKVEQLPAAQDEFCIRNSSGVQFLELKSLYEDYTPANWLLDRLNLSANKKLWLVVHSEPTEAVELLAQASIDAANIQEKPQIVVVSPQPLKVDCQQIDFYPASALFPLADRIYSGCGFNIMRETEKFKDKHYFIPFVRPYDNQHIRAELRKGASVSCQIFS